MKNHHKNKHWPLALLGAATLAGAIGAGIVYWQYFRTDPEFIEAKQRSEETQQELDGLFAHEAQGEPLASEAGP